MNKLMYDVDFLVDYVTPDARPYNQQRQRYITKHSKSIQVSIPINKKNFRLPNKFFEELKLWELGQGDKPEIPDLPFTPAGWAKVMKKLEKPYQEDFDLYEE